MEDFELDYYTVGTDQSTTVLSITSVARNYFKISLDLKYFPKSP